MQEFCCGHEQKPRNLTTGAYTHHRQGQNFFRCRSGGSEKGDYCYPSLVNTCLGRPAETGRIVPKRVCARLMPSPTRSIQRHGKEEERSIDSPSSNVINVDLAVALAVVLAEVEADAALLLAAVGVGLVDLGGLGELAVCLE